MLTALSIFLLQYTVVDTDNVGFGIIAVDAGEYRIS